MIGRLPSKGFLWLLAGTILAGTAVALCGLSYLKFRSEKLSKEFLSSQSFDKSLLLASQLYDDTGAKIGEYAAEQRYFIGIDSLPPHVINAFLAAEDAGFYDHKGVSFFGIARAAIANVSAGEVVQGASTLTQQLARIFFLKSERTMRRKVDEIALAMALEARLGKKRILELYLNKIFLGNHAYGIEAAARNYFNKSAADLDVAEAALLAGVVAAPSKYAPHRYFRKAKVRQFYVLGQMVRKGYLQKSEAQRWLRHDLRVAKKPLGNNEIAPYFVEEVRGQLQGALSIQKLDESGLAIETTLKRSYHEPLRRHLDRLRSKYFSAEVAAATDSVQAAVLAMDMQTGKVLGMQGGVSFGESQFNRIVAAKRPLGSAFMPFYFGLALDRGITLLSSVYEEHKSVLPKISEPERKDDLSAYEALVFGRAPESARMFSWIGIGTVQEASERLGFAFDNHDLSLALGVGSAEPLKLLSAFTVFTRGGSKADAYLISKVLSSDKQLLYENHTGAQPQVISSEAAYMIYQTLLDAARFGSAKISPALQGKFATVVGTDESLHDGWMIGFNQSIGVLLWVGSEFGKTRLAKNEKELRQKMAGFWSDMVEALPVDEDLQQLPTPQGVSFVKLPAEVLGPVAFLPFKVGLEPF